VEAGEAVEPHDTRLATQRLAQDEKCCGPPHRRRLLAVDRSFLLEPGSALRASRPMRNTLHSGLCACRRRPSFLR
jgi:hypothetical protein